MENASHTPTSLNGTIQKPVPFDFLKYPFFTVVIFGILGNTLVIISILRQKCLLKSNYYFCVFQLAICDLGLVLIIFLELIHLYFATESLFPNSFIYCLVSHIVFFFQIGGICMMLIISMLRYRATVHPFKPSISRGKLRRVCVFVYIIGLVGGYGTFMPLCFMQGHTAVSVKRFLDGYLISCFYLFPTLFMAVVYYTICRTLVKEHKYLKRICSNPVTRSTSASSFKVLRYIRNRRTFLICLISVLCYGVGNLPISVWFMWGIVGEHYLQTKYFWVFGLSLILRIAGSCSVNPLIYGILDKKLLTFWKLCPKWKKETRNIRPALVSSGKIQETRL